MKRKMIQEALEAGRDPNNPLKNSNYHVAFAIGREVIPKYEPQTVNISKRKILHVGCGQDTIESIPFIIDPQNWEEVRLDIVLDYNPDVCCELTVASHFTTHDYDMVYCSHVIEHMPEEETISALEQMFTVLKQGGIIVISCPDLSQVCEFAEIYGYDTIAYTTPSGLDVTPLKMIYGIPSHVGMAHKTGFTEGLLRSKLEQVGFKIKNMISN